MTEVEGEAMKVSDEQGYPPGCTRCAERKAEVERLRAQAAAHRDAAVQWQHEAKLRRAAEAEVERLLVGSADLAQRNVELVAEVERLREENAALLRQANEAMRRSERDHIADADRVAEATARAERAEAALREMNVLIPAVMDALESDSQLDVRRAAFESIQEAYEDSHPWGIAVAALAG